MADLDYSVSVDTQGAIQSVKNLETTVGRLTTVFAALAGAISLGALTRFSDEVTNLKNQLNQFSTATSDANAQFKALAAIAIESRSSLASVGDLYARIMRSSKDLGVSQAQAAQITETVSKALVVSGQSAASASGALLQLGQALASGRLQGDELRSILEGMPAIAKILADSLGVPVGALRTLGSSGQISAQQVVEALLKAKDVIDNQFAKTIPTISQAFQTLKTTAQIAFNEFENNTQTGQSFGAAIEYMAFMMFKLSKSVDEIVGPLGTFIKILGAVLAFTVVGRVFEFIGAAIAGTTAFVVRLGAAFSNAVDFVKNFGAVIAAAGGGIGTFGAVIQIILKPIGMLATALGSIAAGVAAFLGLDKLGNWFKSLGDKNSDAGKEMESFRKELGKMKQGLDETAGKPAPVFLDPEKMLRTRQQLEQIVVSYQRSNAELERRLGFESSLVGETDRQRTVRQALFDLESNYYSEINRLVDEYRNKSQSKVAEDQAALPLIQDAIIRVSEAYANQIDVVKKLTEQNYALAEAEKQRVAFQEFSVKIQIDGARKLRDIQADIAKSTMTEIEQKYYDLARAADETARAAIDAENSRRRSLKLAEMTADEEAQYYARSKAGLEDLKRATDAQYETSRRFETGWKRAFNSYVDEATNAARRAEQLFSKSMQGIEDLIVNFVKTGKFEWKNFVASMAEELLRSNIKSVLANIMSPTQGQGGMGGLLGSLGSILGFGSGANAKGQTANNPMYVYDIAGGGAGGGSFGGFAQGGGTFGGGGRGGIFDSMSNVFSGITNTVSNVFGGISRGVSSVFGGIGDLISGGGIGGGSKGGGILSSIGDFFGGFFANGGMIPAGKFGVVGERGPEFVSGPAQVTPMGGGANVTYNINAVDAMSFKQMIAQDPSFIYAVTLQGAKGTPARR